MVKNITQLLNHLATNPDATIRYKRSDMVFWVHSDASCLSCLKAQSRAGGMHFLSDKTASPNNPANYEPTLNWIVYVVCKILHNIMASAAEAKLGALLLNCQETVPIRITPEEIGHAQPPTPVKVDNSTALGIATGTIKQRKSKAMDMQFYWIRDIRNQYQFNIYWKPGSTNRGDYFTKHFPPANHSTVRPSYLHVAKYGKCSMMQGCVNLTLSANHHVHPCAPAKSGAHAYTQNCARIHRKYPEDAHARAQQCTHL